MWQGLQAAAKYMTRKKMTVGHELYELYVQCYRRNNCVKDSAPLAQKIILKIYLAKVSRCCGGYVIVNRVECRLRIAGREEYPCLRRT